MLNLEILQKLLISGHINVFERQEFADNRISVAEIMTFIKSWIKTSNCFPPNISIWSPGKPVYEGAILEKLNEEKYLLHYQRSHAIEPTILAESHIEEYTNLDSAIMKLIKTNWGSNIDGIIIVY